ncbi:hypothetical protein [Streptomyces atratus]|uniref:hypothetical protein n=1 Tax=Streptomyces atratus TaxID=1893 RepID=UPI00225979C1|nr:hypothetical protein [Streptomyces atratus]MCX5338536.1 hypothetical protein [Streptomyces atratus]
MKPIVHIALSGDTLAMCDARMERRAPRAAEPEQAACQECIGTYIEGWAAAQQDGPPGAPSVPSYPPSRRPSVMRYAAMGATAALAVAALGYWALADHGSGENSNIAVAVVDCSQTWLYAPKGGGPMLRARVAQIQFVNNGDSEQVFSAEVDGVTLEGQAGNRARCRRSPHDSKLIGFPMNPTKYGNSKGACYTLDVRAAS